MSDVKNLNGSGGDGWWLWRVSLSSAVIFWERLWRALWPAFAVAGLFLTVALFDLFAFLPGWLHVSLLIVFFGLLGFALWWEFSRFQMPDHTTSRRRLEEVNDLHHRPLEALEDHVAGGAEADPVMRAMWRQHQDRMRDTVSGLRVGAPHPRLARKDGYALRFAVVIGLVVSGVVAGGDAGDRLLRAFIPQVSAAVTREAKLDAWLTPPEYTGMAPVFLSGDAEAGTPRGPMEAPEGSILVAQVSDASEAPLVLSPNGENDGAAFDAMAENSYRARIPLDSDGRFAIELNGRELGAWDIVIVPDVAPTVAFLAEPGQTPLGALRIDFEAHDDYGLAGVVATIRRPESSVTDDEAITFDLPLPGLNVADATGTGYQDLTSHPWAGLEVKIALTARDGRGQRGSSGALTITLPERIFNHPVARQIIEQRKRLTANPQEARDSVGSELSSIARNTEAYDGDTVVFMALSTASRRLKYSSAEDTVSAVQKLLWDTALRLEDGKLSMAARDLRRLQQELMEALANDASDEELNRLIDELQAALDELMDALAQLQPQDLDGMPLDPNAMALDRQDLQNLMDRLRDLAQSGAKDAARQMLSELQNLLESLQAGQMGEMPPQFQQGMNALNALQEMIQAQQELLDRTYKEAQRQQQQGQQGQQGQQQARKDSADTALQEALRRQLGELMRQLGEVTGEIPRQFGRAEGAMRESTEALRGNDPGGAVPAQTEALDQLREGARAATEQMMQQFAGQMAGSMPGQRSGMLPFGRPGQQQDPFGRRTEGSQGATQGDVEIPSESDIQRARRILEELRRRAGERERPPVERDYIDRLLEPY